MSLTRAFATPIIVTADMNQEEFAYEFQRMQLRSQATSEFLSGTLDLENYFEALHEGGVDPFQLCNLWSEGQFLL